MLPIVQLPCHKTYLSVFMIFTSFLGHLHIMLIPHDYGHFCPEMDRN